MPEDVGQHLVEMLGRVRPADIVRSSDRHMTRPFSAPI
jgi:hypothetical protein